MSRINTSYLVYSTDRLMQTDSMTQPLKIIFILFKILVCRISSLLVILILILAIVQIEKTLHSLREQFALTQCIVEPTHFTEHSSSILDIILVNNKNLLSISGVKDPLFEQNIRYHCPIFGILKINKPKGKSFQRFVWNYETCDFEKLRQIARSTNWTDFFDNDINKYAENITERILHISKQCIFNKVVMIQPSE